MTEEVNTPSTGVLDPPLTDVVESSTTTPAKPTEDEIFDKLSHPAEEPPAKTEDKPSEEAAPAVEEPEQEINLEAPPDEYDAFSKFKEHFKLENGTELRQIVGRHAAITEKNADFQQVVQILDRIPTTEDLERVVGESEELSRISETFRTDPVAFLQGFKENDPNAFRNMAKELPRLLESADKSLWIEQRTETVQEVLDNAAQIAQTNGDQAVMDAVRMVAQSLGLRLGTSLAKPRSDPRDLELEHLRKMETERTTNDHRQHYDAFRNSINEEYMNTVITDIETDLKAALAKANIPDAGDSVLKRMVKDAYERLDEKMNSQPDTKKRMGEAFQAAFRDRRMSESDRRGVLDFVTRKAKATRPAVVREVVEEWTKSILGANRKTIQTKQTVAATTKDVGTGTGAPPATNGKPPAAAPPPGKKETFEQIVARLHQNA